MNIPPPSYARTPAPYPFSAKENDIRANQTPSKIYFSEHPFSPTADYRYLYLSEERSSLLEKVIELAVKRSKAIEIVGESGLGKSTLSKRLEFRLSVLPNHYPLYIKGVTSLKKNDFWKNLSKHCGLPVLQRSDYTNIFQFLKQNSQKFRLDLIIDDADELNFQLTEDIQKIDLEGHLGQRLVQIILFVKTNSAFSRESQPQKFVIHPLSIEDVRKMIEFRLFVSGVPKIFSEKAIERIYQLSGGNPREVVNWCRAGLDSVRTRGKLFVDASDIDEIEQVLGLSSVSQFRRNFDR